MNIIRQNYIDKLLSLKDKHFIKVITGIRRCGKSTILKQFVDKISFKNNNVIFIDFTNKENKHLLNVDELEKYIDSKLKQNCSNYLILDEVQEVIGFDKLILSYYQTNENIDIYITGSNSHMLSKKISTYFTGREIAIHIFPFSYKECCLFFKKKLTIEEYMQCGSMPHIYELPEQDKSIVLEGTLDTIIQNDIIPFFNVKDLPLLKKILLYAFDNIGNEFSSTNVQKYLINNKLSRKNISNKTIEKYLSYLIDAYLVYKIKRYDIVGKQVLKTLYKCYACDVKMRNVFLEKEFDYNIGRQLENIVYLELIRKYEKVYIGTWWSTNENNQRIKHEVDFVCKPKQELFYIQVVDNIKDESTYKREHTPFNYLRNGRKIIINNSGINNIQDGIEYIDIVKFLEKGIK